MGTLAIAGNGLERRIWIIRGAKVMLSTHLAELYGVEPRALIQAVKRNRGRFPKDFIFRLSSAEAANLKSQIVISSWGGSRRSVPFAFTEQGVAMLSSVLRSKRAIQVNVAIMRAFVRFRETLGGNKELFHRMDSLERKLAGHDTALSAHAAEIREVFEAIRQLTTPADGPRHEIGFKRE